MSKTKANHDPANNEGYELHICNKRLPPRHVVINTTVLDHRKKLSSPRTLLDILQLM